MLFFTCENEKQVLCFFIKLQADAVWTVGIALIGRVKLQFNFQQTSATSCFVHLLKKQYILHKNP